VNIPVDPPIVDVAPSSIDGIESTTSAFSGTVTRSITESMGESSTESIANGT
jgi:hypothetical protein